MTDRDNSSASEAQRLSARTESLSIIGLDQEAREFGLSVKDQIALGEHQLRVNVAKRILALFMVVNVVVIAGLAGVFRYDVILLRNGSITADHRLVTTEVLMSVIGATTVQLGAVMYMIARYVFPATGSE